MNLRRLCFAVCLMMLSQLACAQVAVRDAWIRATVAQQTNSGAFMTLTSKFDVRLVEVSSPIARAELHEMSMSGNVMLMRKLEALELPAGTAIVLKPGGYHIMLLGLKRALLDGELIPLTLVFEDKSKKQFTQELMVPVKPLNTRD